MTRFAPMTPRIAAIESRRDYLEHHGRLPTEAPRASYALAVAYWRIDVARERFDDSQLYDWMRAFYA